jgi:hypothetical protein
LPYGGGVDHQQFGDLSGDSGDDELSWELWGYGVWSFVAVVIAVPELWAIYANPPWPTISATLAHLEQRRPWVSLLIVTVIVATIVEILTRLHATPTGAQLSPSEVSLRLGRTDGGRTVPGSAAVGELDRGAWTAYLATSTLVVALALRAAHSNSSRFTTGYVVYGLIATLLVVIPNLLVTLLHREVPFPTLVQTIANLEQRWHPAIVIVTATMVILLLHLAFYPWPTTPTPPPGIWTRS